MGNNRSLTSLLTLTALTLTGIIIVLPADAAAAAPPEPSVAGRPIQATPRTPGAEDIARPVKAAPTRWPVPGTVRTKSSNVDVVIRTLDPAAVARMGGIGLGVQVERADGKRRTDRVEVTLDYSGFANAYGASFADRLRVVKVPGHERVTARNDLSAYRMKVTVDAGPGPAPTFMLAASAGGSFSGNFGATDLAPTGTWQTGLSSGSFNYSYPIPTPPQLKGESMALALQYNSSSVDGMTSASNAQSGWAGLGWQLSPGYIERRYRPCAEDARGPGKKAKQKDWGHLCWESPDENDSQPETTDPTNSDLYLSLNGRSTRIVKDRLSGTWKTQEELGWRIEYLQAGASGQPYWRVTTQTGAVHRFGYRRDSMWQVPYAGDDTGEPCNSQYANSGRDYPGLCQGPWRWNIDEILDPNENLTTLYWKRESGKYAWHVDEVCCGVPPTYEYTPIDYDRGGYLDYVESGANTTIAASRATSKVQFNMVSRCSSTTTRDDPLANPYPIDTGTGNLSCGGYPNFDFWDVPDDLVQCDRYQCNAGSPAFFIMRRLDSIVTYVWNGSTWEDSRKLQLRFNGTTTESWLDGRSRRSGGP